MSSDQSLCGLFARCICEAASAMLRVKEFVAGGG